MSEASLQIKVDKDSIEFELQASSGGNSGELEGHAVVVGNKARFVQRDENDSCIIEFELRGDTLIEVGQLSGICGAGMGVEYSGEYYSGKLKEMIAEDKDEDVAVLDDAQENSILKALTGKDYDLFVKSTQLTSDDSDVDGLGARVHSTGVRGLFTEMENIVMIDSQKNIWAAVISDDTVLYYTNRKDYADRLPKTIDKWRERFNQYPVVYKSRP